MHRAAARMRRAYHADSALAAELDRAHPSAAASLREGLAETLTVLRVGVPPTLARTLRSTKAIESMISICRAHASNVKRWRDGQMALRDTLNKVTQTVGVNRPGSDGGSTLEWRI